jgi:hypothetical protein
MVRFSKILVVLLLIFPTIAAADDFYVITGTYKTQKEAQQIAANKGGWVLYTNFYSQLTPNLFAVVRGPFKTNKDADKELAFLKEGGRYPGSYVKNAGAINIGVKIGNKALSPQMLAALLGEIRIDVMEQKGGGDPCEPEEPYKQLSLSYVTVERSVDEKKEEAVLKPREVEIDAGVFWEIKRTGEVEHMRICAE